jgi:hypothetical protein
LTVRDVASNIAELKCCCDKTASTAKSAVGKSMDSGIENVDTGSVDVEENDKLESRRFEQDDFDEAPAESNEAETTETGPISAINSKDKNESSDPAYKKELEKVAKLDKERNREEMAAFELQVLDKEQEVIDLGKEVHDDTATQELSLDAKRQLACLIAKEKERNQKKEKFRKNERDHLRERRQRAKKQACETFTDETERGKKRKAINTTTSLDDLGDCLLIKKSKLENKNADQSTIISMDNVDPLSRQAFLLANQALKDETIWKQLIVSMTIKRDWTRPNAGLKEPERGHVLSKAFLWSTVPTLELVLIDNMKEYYRFSSFGQCKTKEQLEFNHRLLLDVKKCAADMGWIWGEGYETDSKIRERIVRYYSVSLCVFLHCFD